MRKDRRVVDTHGRAALEIARNQKRQPAHALHPVDERRQLVRLGALDHTPLRHVDQDQPADAHVADEVHEPAVFAGARADRVAGERNHHQLRHFVVQAERFHPAVDTSLCAAIARGRRRDPCRDQCQGKKNQRGESHHEQGSGIGAFVCLPKLEISHRQAPGAECASFDARLSGVAGFLRAVKVFRFQRLAVRLPAQQTAHRPDQKSHLARAFRKHHVGPG